MNDTEKEQLEHIIKMLGGKLVQNKCPEYFIWKFPNEVEEYQKTRLPIENIEQVAALTRPTWKKFNFKKDFNKLMLGVKCAKHLWYQAHRHRQDLGTVVLDNNKMDPFETLARNDMEIDFALRNVNEDQIFVALSEFAKTYNENKTVIFSK
jgi:hypothetical protein